MEGSFGGGCKECLKEDGVRVYLQNIVESNGGSWSIQRDFPDILKCQQVWLQIRESDLGCG